MEKSINLKSLLGKALMPSEVLSKMKTMEEIENLYNNANKLISFLIKYPNESVKNLSDIEKIQENILTATNRLKEFKKILNQKAKLWGLEEKGNKENQATKEDKRQEFDMSAASDEPIRAELDTDSMKFEIKKSLKSISDLLDYLEPQTLFQLQKKIDKLL